MGSTYIRAVWIAAAGLTIVCGACDDSTKSENKIILGSILPQTGDLRGYGPYAENGAMLAVQEINAAGGLLGKLIDLDRRDGKTDPVAGKAQAMKLIDDVGVPAIVGDMGSTSTLDIAAVAAPKKVVVISGASTSPRLTNAQDDGYLFRTCFSDAFQGAVLADVVAEDGYTKVAVLYVDNAYGAGLADVFKASFESKNGHTVVVSHMIADGLPAEHDWTTDFDAIANAAPDAIVMAAYQTAATSIFQTWNLNRARFAGQWYLTDSLRNEALGETVGTSLVAGIKGTGPAPGQGSTYAGFKSAYVSTFGVDPGSYAENFYDAVMLVGLAIAKAGSADGTAIRDALPLVATPDGTLITPGEFKKGLAELEAGRDVNYEGASGSVDFDQFGDVAAPVEIWQFTASGEIESIGVVTP